MEKEKKARRGFGAVQSVFSCGERVTVEGQERVSLTGCRRILTYTSICIRLRRRHSTVVVRGSGLYCVSFSCGCATLSGRIDAVEWERAEEGER